MIVLATATSQHQFWLWSRATGTVALICACLAVAVGFVYELVMEDRERAIRLAAAHEALGLGAIGFLVVHGFLLLGDKFLNPNLADIVVPFAQSYRRSDIGFGVLGGYVMGILAVLYYVRNRIGPAVFRKVHRFTVVGWFLAMIHTFGAGTAGGPRLGRA